MREILFRGKHIHLFQQNEHLNGAWVYGYLCDRNYINSPGLNGELLVDPSTIGQYTGLKDKNGNGIWEGDIVQYTERRLGGEDVSVAHPVTFDEGGFCVHPYFLNNWLRNGLCGNTTLEDIEVIGNIHDNPELLEEA